MSRMPALGLQVLRARERAASRLRCQEPGGLRAEVTNPLHDSWTWDLLLRGAVGGVLIFHLVL
jgi:cobalamin biosynthesis Mg chelatase CobN